MLGIARGAEFPPICLVLRSSFLVLHDRLSKMEAGFHPTNQE